MVIVVVVPIGIGGSGVIYITRFAVVALFLWTGALFNEQQQLGSTEERPSS